MKKSKENAGTGLTAGCSGQKNNEMFSERIPSHRDFFDGDNRRHDQAYVS